MSTSPGGLGKQRLTFVQRSVLALLDCSRTSPTAPAQFHVTDAGRKVTNERKLRAIRKVRLGALCRVW